jgi:acetylornithine deacetylase/succinyl-diaminopimelate desuccinylase-like protein
MDARHDAACAAAEWVLAVEAAARREPGLVATVGRLEARPGAPNVVPGAAVASLDVRHPEDAVREAAVAALRDEARDRRRARVEVGVARGHERARRSPPTAR